jgi:hypothetical protein
VSAAAGAEVRAIYPSGDGGPVGRSAAAGHRQQVTDNRSNTNVHVIRHEGHHYTDDTGQPARTRR